MTVVDYILDGLYAELALERELGINVIECDRELLEVKAPIVEPKPIAAEPKPVEVPKMVEPIKPAATSPRAEIVGKGGPKLDFVFLHNKPLSPDGNEMLSKIILAMGRTAETAPIVIESPIPRAKVYIVLGGLALRKFFPEFGGAPGQWRTLANDAGEVLITYSPEYILRFGTVTAAVQQMKKDMWQSLKIAMQKVRQ